MVDRKQQPRAIDEPAQCFVKMKLERHGGYVPARIFERLGLLTAEIDGQPSSIESVWTAGEIITEAEWLTLVADRQRPKPF